MPKDTDEFIEELQSMGLTVNRKARGGHFKVYTSDGHWVMDFSHSSSDRNWRKAATRRLRVKLVEIYGEGTPGQVQGIQRT
jgi:hypothetical protein